MRQDKVKTSFSQVTDRGVSTVIGVTVLVGVVVLLAALVGGVVFGLADTNQDTAFAGVTVSQIAGSTVEVRVDSMGEAEALLVDTAGGRQVITSPGIYEYDSFGQEVRIIGSDGETTQLLRTFEPDVDPTETADILTVESDQTVQSTTGNQTFETLDAAKQAAESGDVIRFASGIHVQPDTVNETVTTPVTIVAEPNTVFSCDKTKVNLRLQNATMSQRSAFIQTNQCGFQPVTVPAPEGSGGSVDVLAGGSDTSTANGQTGTQSGTDATVFDSTTDSSTPDSDSQPAATTDTSVTLRVSSTSNYQSLTINTQAGSRTFTEEGVYSVETYGYNATITGETGSGETVQLDTIVSEEQQPDVTADTTRNGETVNQTETQPVDTYLVEADESNTVASETNDSVKRVSTLSQADSQASQGDLIKLESGVHSDPDTVAVSLSTNATLAIGTDVELSCEQTKIDLSLGEASLSEQSPFPDVFCDEYSGVSEDSVTETLNSSGVSIPDTVSFDEALVYNNGRFSRIQDVTTDNNGNVYVTGYSYGSDGQPDYYTIKYDANGNEVWSQRYDNGKSDYGYGIAVDSNGNVYVTGKSKGSDGQNDYYTVKYDANGNEVWSQRYDNGGRDRARGIAVDSSGNVYVTGDSRDSGNYDYYTIKYDAQGNEVWSQRDDSGDYDFGRGIAVDSSGNVYVTGGSDGSDGEDDYYTIKYDAQGNKVWSQRDDTGGLDTALGVAVDSNGNVYVTGFSDGSDNENDYYTIKYNTTGGEEWHKRYDGGEYNTASGISVTDNGTVYVGGEAQNNYHLRKYTGS